MEFILTIIVILIYYLLFVKSQKDENALFYQPDHHYVPPPYKSKIQNNEISVSPNLVWHIPNLPPRYQWLNNDKIIERNHCIGKPDGEYVPGTSESIYSYIQKYNTKASFMAPKGTPNFDIRKIKLDHFFECKDQTENKLYFCPIGTMFDKNTSSCVSSDICRHRANGYRYTLPNIPFSHFFECENGEKQLKSCPLGEIFDRVTDQCRPPHDLCLLKPDDSILTFDRNSYTVCENFVSRKRYCNTDEYFHPVKKKCTSSICENKHGNVEMNTFKTEKYWKYKSSYTVCNQGIAVKHENCASIFVDDDLPQTMVYANGYCQKPKLCVNVWPKHQYVPGHKFRSLMSNYKHSPLYDQLYGFECHQNKPHKVNMLAGHKISLDDGQVEICSNNELLPIIDNERNYFNCQQQTTQFCGNNEVFDFGRQSCLTVDDRFHRFENKLSVFRLTGLSPEDDWFMKRPIRHSADLQCAQNQFFDATYNVCVDLDCRYFEYISLIPGRKIYVNDQYLCKEENGEVVKENYDSNNMYLNFWKQKFSYGIPANHCKRGITRLHSEDFLLNSILYPTCSADGSREPHFVICPSTSTYKIHSTPSLCYPEHPKGKIFWEYLEDDGLIHTFFKLDIASIEVLEDQTFIWMWDMDTNGVKQQNAQEYSVGTKVNVYNINPAITQFTIQVSKKVKLLKTFIATNHPRYFIKETGTKGGHNIGSDRVKHSYDINLIMEKYTLAESLQDFM